MLELGELVVVALLPLLATLSLYLPSGLASPLRILTLLLLVDAAVRVVRRPRLLRSPMVIGTLLIGACFAGFGVLGLVRFPDHTSVVDFGHVGFMVLLMVAMSVVGRRRAVTLGLLCGWFVAGLLASAVGVWESVTSRHLSVNLPGAAYGREAESWRIVSAFFDNPNLYAYMLAVLIPLTVLGLLGTRIWYVQVLAVLLLVLFGQQLIMTDGRAAMLVVAITAALLMMRSWPGRGLLVAGGLVFWAALKAGVGPAVALWAMIYKVYDEIDEAPRSSWLRVQLIKSGWHMLRESDWLGVGPGGYGVRNVWDSNPVNIWNMPNAHSGMIEVLAEYGVVTAAVFLLGLAAAALACLWLGERRRRRDLAAGVSAFSSRWSYARVSLAMTAIMVISVPVISLANSTWLRQPLTAVHLATLVAMVASVLARTRVLTGGHPHGRAG